MSTSEYYNILQLKISRLRRRENAIDFLKGVLVFTGSVSLVIIANVLIESVFILQPPERWILVFVNLLLFSGGFVYYLLLPAARWSGLIRSYNDRDLTDAVGRTYPELKDRLTNAMDLFRQPVMEAHVSGDLASAFLKQIYDRSEPLDFGSAAGVSRIYPSFRFFLISVSVFFLTLILFFSTVTSSLSRLMNPDQVVLPVKPYEIVISPGNTEILYEQPAVIKITVRVLIPDVTLPGRISVFTKPEGVEQFREEIIRQDSAGFFSYTVPGCRQDFEYYAETSEKSFGKTVTVRSDVYRISVIKRPSVKRLRTELAAPAYTRSGVRELDENAGDIIALKGTRVTWRIESTKPLRRAEVVFHDSAAIPMTISSFSPLKAECAWFLSRSGRYHFVLTDTTGVISADPIEYPVTVVQDEYPVIRLLDPEKDIDITESMLVSMTGDVQDDFGFSKLQLKFKLDATKGFMPPQETYRSIDLTFLLPAGSTQSTVQYTWSLDKLNLMPEDVMSFYLEVSDNDAVSGPKSAQTVIRRLRFPSLAEMFDEANRQQDQVFDKTEDLIKAADEVKKELDELNRDLLKNKKLEWKEQEKARQLIEKQQKMQKEIDEVKNQVQEITKKLEENKLISKETLDKYQELQKLLSEIYNKDFQDMMQKLQQSMKQNLDQRKIKDAMKQMQADQESLKKNLDRTVELLKRIKAEQMFDQLKKEMEDLIRRQEQVNTENSKNPSKETRESLSKEQKRIEESLNRMQNQSEDLKSLVKDIDKQFKTDELDKAIQQMKSGAMQNKMQKSSQSMKSNPSASKEERQNQESVSDDLKSLSRQMNKARDEYRSQQDEQIMAAMRKIVFDLLELSQQQEDLITETRNTPLYGNRLPEIVRKQGDIRSGMTGVTDQLIALSNQTFFVTSTLGKTVGRALTGMNESVRSLEERSTSAASNHQNTAMVAINDAVKLLMQSMNRMQQGQSGTGLQQMMDDLQQMAGQQGKINDGTMPFAQGQGQEGNEGQMSLEQQAALGRMMAEQQALREALGQMSGQLQGQESLKGQLDKMAKEMDEVIRDMKNKNVTRETIRRQQQILQRMLDASRSMREREYSEKRKGETAKEYLSKSPVELPDNMTDRKNLLRRDLLKSLKEGYAKDYEELIKLYFEALGNVEAGQ